MVERRVLTPKEAQSLAKWLLEASSWAVAQSINPKDKPVEGDHQRPTDGLHVGCSEDVQ